MRKSTFSSLNLPQILREGKITIFLEVRQILKKYPVKAAVRGGRPDQDWNLWEQFGKLMFDWEEGTVVWSDCLVRSRLPTVNNTGVTLGCRKMPDISIYVLANHFILKLVSSAC